MRRAFKLFLQADIAVVIFLLIWGIVTLINTPFPDANCSTKGLCKQGLTVVGCTPCGDSCVISKTNCSALGGKWDNGHNACQLGFEQREPAVCAALGGKWDKTLFFKCDFTDLCKAQGKQD